MSAEKGVKQEPPRTIQRMLDLERQIKLDRMQGCNPSPHPAQTNIRAAQMQAMNHQGGSQDSSRTMTASDISHTISPAPNHQSNGTLRSSPTMKEISGGAMLGAQDNDSDRMSICRSPGWEDSRKRKKAKQGAKEARKQEKEKAAKEIKELRPSRLTKAPPTSKGLSKLSTPLSRSDSSRVFQAPSHITDPVKNKPESNRERTSNDAGSRKSVPWSPAITTPSEEAMLPDNEGFIGGLKLQQATQAIAQESFRKRMAPAVKVHKSNFIEDFADAEANEGISVSNLRNESLNDASMEPKGRAYDRTLLSSWESSDRESTKEKPEAHGPRGWKGKPLSSRLSIQHAAVTKHITLDTKPPRDAALPSAKIEESSLRKCSKPSKVASSERPPVSYREVRQIADPERHSRRGSFSSLLGKRQQSKDRSTTKEEYRPPTATTAVSTHRRSRSSSWSFAMGSRKSFSRPTTADSLTSNNSSFEDGREAYCDRNGWRYPPEPTRSSKEGLSAGDISRASHHLQGLKAAAKAAFSRNSYPSKPRSSLPHRTASSSAEKLRPTSVSSANLTQMKSPASQFSHKAENIVSQEAIVTEIRKPNDTSNQQNGQNSNSSSSKVSNDNYHPVLDEKATVTRAAALESPSDNSNTQTLEDSDATIPPLTHSTPHLAALNPTDCGATRRYEGSEGKALSTFSTPNNPRSSINAQDLSFLPPLKHQPLTRPGKSNDKEISSANYPHDTFHNHPAPLKHALAAPSVGFSSSSASSPISPRSSRNDLARQRHNLPDSPSASRLSLSTAGSQETNTRAKMLVVCCKCRYFHDMPSKVYECMAKPDNVVRDLDLGVSGVITTRVKCPWCEHGMSITCCEGWAAVVVLKERLH